ncbi:PPR: pentatricopeptide repeat domain containing protein [Nitzschia inconspicua]|uniref:PPR: pentatricopeptide repeat domain containing protein n=1 Tax=Nitzschia inconspicua TaxID=303405 RepID=A0A9K3LD18_9STRA|nr:PPR: pentatricopeptide repeat domain containing protein [Nitzschia inconspicua]
MFRSMSLLESLVQVATRRSRHWHPCRQQQDVVVRWHHCWSCHHHLTSNGSQSLSSWNRTARSFATQNYDNDARKQNNNFPTRKSSNSKQKQHTRTTKKRPYQQKAQSFLEAVRNGRIQRQVVPQKVEELLLLCVSDTAQQEPSDGPLALDLLNAGISNANLPHERLIPRLFSLACQILVRSGNSQAFWEVHRQLWRLLDGHQTFLVNDKIPATIAYNSRYVNDACSQLIHFKVMQAVNKKTQLDKRSLQEIQHLIERLEQYHTDPTVPLVGDGPFEDSIVMFLCHQQKTREAFERVRQKVKSYNTFDIIPYQPPISTFTTIVASFAKAKQPEQARKVIEWMLTEQESKTGSIVPPPNVACFNALAHAYATVGGTNAGYKAEETLQWMQELHETKFSDLVPDVSSFNITINAWARSGHSDAPQRAEKVLQQMIQLSEAGQDTSPTEESWCSVMNTWVNSSKPGSVDRVAAILDLMEQLYDNNGGTKLMSDVPYTTYVKAWEKESERRRGRRMEAECTDNILQVIDRMEARGLHLTPEIFNAVLTAIAKISPNNGILYFLELERLYRDGRVQLATRTFNIGLNAIATLNRPDAEEKAFHVLQRMEEYAKTDPTVTPSRYTFNIMIKALSRSHDIDAAERADTLLRKMDAMPLISPDCTSYITCIIAWGRSQRSDKFERVKELLIRFLQSSASEDARQSVGTVNVFNAALSVCHHNAVATDVSSAKTAMFVMEEIRRNDIRPDQTTYTSFFKVMAKFDLHGHPESSELSRFLKEEFVHCIDDGMVAPDIMKAVIRIAPTVLVDIIGKDIDWDVFAAPSNWSKNVKN